MKRTALLPCLLLILSPVLSSAQNFTLEQILGAPFPSALVAAPNSSQLAWVQNDRGLRNIWTTEKPGAGSRQLTTYEADDGQEIGDLVFTPDGSKLLYVRGGAPNRGGEIPNPTSQPDGAKREIWIIPLAEGEPRLLAEGSSPTPTPDGQSVLFINRGQVWSVDTSQGAEVKPLFRVRGSASTLVCSPDKANPRLAFITNRGDHAFLGVFDLKSRVLKYLAPSVDQDAYPAWSPDGRQIAFLRFPHEKELIFIAQRSALPWSILVADADSGQARTIWTSPKGRGSAFRTISAVSQLFWSAAGHLVFPYEGDGWTHLWAVPAAGGDARCLTPGDFEVQYVAMSPNGRDMLYSANQDDIDRQHIWRIQIEGGKPQLLTPGKGIEWLPVPTPTGEVAMLASTGQLPARAVYLDGSGKLQPLAPQSLPKEFPSAQLVEPEPVIFSAADGMQIRGQLFRPRNIQPGEKRPALLFFHGGSRRQMLLGFHHREYYHHTYAMNQFLAAQGYIVLSVNYRSGIGYGLEFREALNYGADGASEFNDVLGAGLYMQNRPDVDPQRIGLWGGSYGGYLTALGLARASDLFAAGVDLHGVHDWNAVIKNFIPTYDPTAQSDLARRAYESSPMAFMDGWRSPVLLIHGDDDRNVPFSETVDVAESLRRHGVYFEQLIFPDEVHGFLLHRNWLAAFLATADFFSRKLKQN